jgi:hypothetical protein
MVSIDKRVQDRQHQLDHLMTCFVIYKPPHLPRSKMQKGACGVHGLRVFHVVIARSLVNSTNKPFFRRFLAVLTSAGRALDALVVSGVRAAGW